MDEARQAPVFTAHCRRLVSERKPMANTSNTIDSVAIIALCLIGLTCNLLAWTLAPMVGLGRMISFSAVAFAIAALILRRLFRLPNYRPYGLLVFGLASVTPSVYFMAILFARAIYGR
jgi:hypothetical protein